MHDACRSECHHARAALDRDCYHRAMAGEYREDSRSRCASCARPLAAVDVRYEHDGSIACSQCVDAHAIAAATRVGGSIERSWLRNAAIAVSRVLRNGGW